MFANTYIVDCILTDNVLQTTKHDKLFNQSVCKFLFMTIS